MDIKEFYLVNKVDNDFDEIFYQMQYPETKDFAEPYCSNIGIDDRHRLFYHWSLYGKKIGMQKYYKSNYNLDIVPNEDTFTTLTHPYVCFKPEQKLININIILSKHD